MSNALALPVRILGPRDDPSTPVVTVDGITKNPGLTLSHWPGNDTPAEFKHDLSTGAALAFARLPEDERRARIGEARAIVNNHYDTDGCLALYAVRHPERALPRSDAMLAAAAAGDFFRWPSDDALVVDAIVSELNGSPDSPLAPELDELGDADDGHGVERWNRCVAYLFEHFDDILDGRVEPWRALWEPVLARAHADRERLAGWERADVDVLDLCVWEAPLTALERVEVPGRHALFGSTSADRAAVLVPTDFGTYARVVVSTLSWFDLVTETRSPRPDLRALADRLNAIEGTTSDRRVAWRAQPSTNASPELWFGRRDVDAFAEHNDALLPSALSPARLRDELHAALA